jgi:hypothetical protein
MTEETTTQTEEVNPTRRKIVTWALSVPAAMSLAMSASTSYRFAAGTLGITDFAERMALCATAEAAIIGLTLHAWGAKSKASAWLAYGFVGVQAVPAFEVSGGLGGIVRIVLGPVMLALMLHKLLGIETKLSGKQSAGLFASAGREIRERLTARLGIGRRGADSAAIARSRAADRAVSLASGRKLGRRKADRLAVAVDAAQHGLGATDAAAAEASVVARVVRRKSVAGLHGIDARHVWSTTPASASVPASGPGSSAPASASRSASGMRTRTAPVAGQAAPVALTFPAVRHTRPVAVSASVSASDEAQKAAALDFARATFAATGKPVSMRGLMRGMRVGQATATELAGYLAAQRADGGQNF